MANINVNVFKTNNVLAGGHTLFMTILLSMSIICNFVSVQSPTF